MSGKAKIQDLTNEWYGFTVVSALVNGVMALFGSGLFAVVTVPLVIGFAVIGLAITWALGRLLINRSSVTRFILLVLSPVVLVCGCFGIWQMLTGPWSFGMVVSMLLTAAAMWMHGHSFLTLLDKDVRAYFR